MEHEGSDPPLSKEQSDLVSRLTREQLDAIDSGLFAQCAGTWRKVSYIVASAMTQLELHGVPDVFFANRLNVRVSQGALEGRGDFSCMRYCEVRLPVGSCANAP